MTWLKGYGHRYRLTLDSGDVDGDLSDFPVTLHLNNRYTPELFSEYTSNSLRKKMAVTLSDGVTQCYVEIEKFDASAKKAQLHVKVPSVLAATDTTLFLYYDKFEEDNGQFVGDPDSAVAENVWDDDYVFVCHMRDDPDTSHVRDSTTEDNDGTKTGAAEPAVAAAKIGEGQDLDGNDDNITLAADASLNIASNQTLECWIRLDNLPSAGKKQMPVFKTACYGWRISEFGNIGYFVWGNSEADTVGTPITAGADYHIAWTYDGANHIIYVNGSVVLNNAVVEAIPVVNNTVRFGTDGGVAGYEFFKGLLDEFRVSDTAVRSAAWIKASYESQRDDFVTYGAVEHRSTIVNKRYAPKPKASLTLLRLARDWLERKTAPVL